MSSSKPRVPSYRKKTVANRKYGCVSLPNGLGGRRDILLGPYGSKESKAEYARVVSEWLAADKRLPTTENANDITVNELLVAFLPHAERHYRHPDGRPTREFEDVKISLRPLKQLYGLTLAKSFGPLALKAVRDQMVRQPIVRKVKVVDPATGKKKFQEKVLRVGLARNVCNQRIGRIRRVFKWAVENELVPATVYQALQAVSGLQRGRSDARETKPVRPVSIALVEETLPYLTPTIADMLRLELFTGARIGEICGMKATDIDMTGEIWLFRPTSHKVAHRGLGRIIPIGPKGQQIIRKYLRPRVDAFLFSPADTMEAFRQKQRQDRKTKVQPSQVSRKKKRPRRAPGDHYIPRAIAHAITVACKRAGVQHWHSHQLRHSVATAVRREYGLDAARALLGQHGPQVTELYAELDQAKAVEIVKQLG